MKQETFNSKRGLKEVQLKEPNTCEHYKEVGCIKDVCNCYTLISKQETLEEFIIREGYPIGSQQEIWEDGVRNGAQWQQERSYSEEDMKNAFDSAREFNSLDGIVDVHIVLPMGGDMSDLQPLHFTFEEWFEQFKKK